MSEGLSLQKTLAYVSVTPPHEENYQDFKLCSDQIAFGLNVLVQHDAAWNMEQQNCKWVSEYWGFLYQGVEIPKVSDAHLTFHSNSCCVLEIKGLSFLLIGVSKSR